MKRMIGIDIGSYTFNALTKQITIDGVGSLFLNQFLLITNTSDNIIIYNFADPNLGGSLLSLGSSYILTLSYDTTSMDNSDNLQIFVEIENNKEESLMLLRNILKICESKSVVDPRRRQKIVVDAIGTVDTVTPTDVVIDGDTVTLQIVTQSSTEIDTTLPVSSSRGTSVTSGGQGPTESPPTLATTVYQPVWEGPVDQRWRVIEDSRIAFKKGIRANLIFS